MVVDHHSVSLTAVSVDVTLPLLARRQAASCSGVVPLVGVGYAVAGTIPVAGGVGNSHSATSLLLHYGCTSH